MFRALVSDYRRGLLLALAGIVVLSFDALLVRWADAPPADVSFWRGALIAVALAAFQWLRGSGLRLAALRSWEGAAAACLFGVNTVLFVFSLAHTAVANTIVILALAPLFAALWSRLWTSEPVRRDTLAAAMLAVAGVVVVVGGSIDTGRWVGDGLALIASAVVSAGLTVLRNAPSLERVPVIMASGAVTALLTAPFVAPFSLPAASYPPLVLMGLLQIPLAMVLLAVATRHLSAPEVSLVMLLEILLGPLWVWLAMGEEPPRQTVWGGAVILLTLSVYFARRLKFEPSG